MECVLKYIYISFTTFTHNTENNYNNDFFYEQGTPEDNSLQLQNNKDDWFMRLLEDFKILQMTNPFFWVKINAIKYKAFPSQ